MKISTVLTGMATVNLLMSNLLSESIAIDALNPVNETVLTISFRTNMIIHFISIEFPTECRRVTAVNKGFQVNTYFLGFRKWNVVTLKK